MTRRLAATACVIGLAAPGCAPGDTLQGISGAQPDPPADWRTCAIADVSGTTRQARAFYPAEFVKVATAAAERGSGELCLVVAGGNPAESRPMLANVGPANRGNSVRAPAEIRENVALVTDQFTGLLTDPPVRDRHSGLVEAAVVAAPLLRSGDRLSFFTDAQQNTEVLALTSVEFSPAGIDAALDRLERKGLLPSLAGVKVTFVLPGFRPDERSPAAARKAAKAALFWKMWAERVGAELHYGEASV